MYRYERTSGAIVTPPGTKQLYAWIRSQQLQDRRLPRQRHDYWSTETTIAKPKLQTHKKSRRCSPHKTRCTRTRQYLPSRCCRRLTMCTHWAGSNRGKRWGNCLLTLLTPRRASHVQGHMIRAFAYLSTGNAMYFGLSRPTPSYDPSNGFYQGRT